MIVSLALRSCRPMVVISLLKVLIISYRSWFLLTCHQWWRCLLLVQSSWTRPDSDSTFLHQSSPRCPPCKYLMFSPSSLSSECSSVSPPFHCLRHPSWSCQGHKAAQADTWLRIRQTWSHLNIISSYIMITISGKFYITGGRPVLGQWHHTLPICLLQRFHANAFSTWSVLWLSKFQRNPIPEAAPHILSPFQEPHCQTQALQPSWFNQL